MKPFLNIFILLLISIQISLAQSGSITGEITTTNSSKKLHDVNVRILELSLGTVSNYDGKYSFNNIPDGNYTIQFSHIGYKIVAKKTLIKNSDVVEVNVKLLQTPISLGEARVVSSRTDKIIREVSLPIEVVNKNTIEKSIKFSVSDLMGIKPGVSTIKDSPWGTAINVRGLSKQNIVYLLDGNRIETATNIAGGLSLIDLSDIHSIEIVKGGLSSLYGTGATGGVVNITTSKPISSEHFFINGSIASSFSSVNSGIINNLSMNTGGNKWFLKVNGTLRNAEDSETPNGTLTNSMFNDKSISTTLGFDPTKNIELKIDYQNFYAWDVGIPGGSPFPKSATARFPETSREMISGIINIKNLFSTFTNTSIKYYHQLIKREVELLPNAKVIVNPKADHITDGILLKTDFVINKNNHLIAGIDAWQREYVGERIKTIKPLNKIVVDKPVPNSKFKSLGLFVQNEMHILGNQLKLTVGGRYDFINITNEETNNPNYILDNGTKLIPPIDQSASYPESDETNKSFSGNVGILYSLIDNVDITFNTAYTFRSPSLEERYQFIDLGGVKYFGNPNLEPERGLFFDVGLRVWKDNISFKVNAFVNSFNNLVIDEVVIIDSVYKKQNVGKAQLYGFDTKLEYNFYRNYVIYSSAAFVRGKETESNFDLPEIPPFNGSLGITFPIKNYVNMDFSSTIYASQNNIAPNETRSGGYTVFDMAISSFPIDLGILKVKIFGGVENLFNKAYKNHLSTYRGINLIEPGRNIYAKLKVNF
ncbi:MAG: TonB-dependent receptor [Melioribacteraceae bacterium]